MAKKPTTAKAAPADADTQSSSVGEDTVAAPNTDDPNLFNGADPALFDHDGDGHAGGSLPKDAPDYPPEQPPIGSDTDSAPTPPDFPSGAQDSVSVGYDLPTVGRIVHFFENSAQEKPLAAMVTEVDPEFGIKLTIFRPNITIPYSNFVPHLDGLERDGPCWMWPPYVPTKTSPPIANVSSLADRFPGATGSTVFGVPK